MKSAPRQTVPIRLAALFLLVSTFAGRPIVAQAPAADDVNFTHLARQGNFELLLASLKSDHDVASDGLGASLIDNLEAFCAHRAAMLRQREEAYETAMAELAEQTALGELEEALSKALEAHNLVADPEAMRSDPRVQTLVSRTAEAALAAEQEGDWIEALSFYRAVDLLYDNSSPEYHAHVSRALKRVRVLRLYAPRRLYDFSVARAQEEDREDEIQPFNDEDANWEERLKGSNRRIVDEVLRYTTAKHITGPSLAKLTEGAVDGLLVLLDSREALAETFPTLADDDAVGRFRIGLLDIRDLVRHRKRSLNMDVARDKVIRPVFKLNDATVKLPEIVISHEMAEGAVAGLDDFTSIIWPYDKETFSRNTKGNFYGVGIQIALKHNPELHREELLVVSPLPDSPAYRAGVKADDIIDTVDDRPTKRWSLDRAVREITGPEGTVVTLGIKRDGEETLLYFPITRAQIEIASVRGWELVPDGSGQWDYWIDPNLRIGYVRLSQFIPETAGDLDKAFETMRHDGPIAALILDLRYNPGGLLKSAIEISDRFIADGAIVSTVGANRIGLTPAFRAQPRNTQPPIPIVVLINQHSASASEIVAGALQDWDKGRIIGVRSFGKGSVQDLLPLDRRKAYLKLTTQYYMLPRGRIIHREPTATQWGIRPDLSVKMTSKQTKKVLEVRRETDVIRSKEELAAITMRELQEEIPEEERIPSADDILNESLDPQLQTALLLLKTQLLAERFPVTRSEEATAEAIQ